MNDVANININDIIKIAHAAGTEILKVYNAGISGWDVSFKSDSSPLTLADKRSNALICNLLTELFPDIPIISEENKEIPYCIRKDYQFFWLIDPLDGTKEFIKRNGEYTVNIALINKNKPVIGIVHLPVLQITYYAVKGSGAYCINPDGEKMKISAKSFCINDDNLNIVASRSHMNEETLSFIKQFREAKIVSMGSSMKLILVAEGKAHIYPRLGPTMEWDTAAAQIIVEESGGSVIDFQHKKKLQYNKENLLNNHFVVYGNVSPCQ